ncbi:UDP-N-acetylglucosamine 4,6-dehydratase [Parageobacillus thermoglucosidasius]|uniref:polysaccharide biosynthesis protein n=1 Tax=Parageobacillus thermoglucosidasius TaxID=1426 RepID=UPI000F61A624|nr:nucleoside-diphosphate sugar epimerase/dehydratase [Parageobacillus thermoglucosidasius]GCD81083.1 UDP-N-acetylglucosamine 4,6-dehydratase [Parageobacillus thermoglucosidasius]
MDYQKRLSLLIILDSMIVLSAIYFSYFLLHPTLPVFSVPVLYVSSITLLASHHIFAFIFRLYQRAWEYASVSELLAIVYSVTISVGTAAIIQYIINQDIYFRVLAVTWMIHIIAIGGSRFAWRVYRDQHIHVSKNKKRALIVGAGKGGNAAVRQLLKNESSDIEPVAFVDDDPKKQRLQFYGITVEGTTKDIPHIVAEKKIDYIIIAIPSLKRKEMQAIYEQCAKANAKTKIMPMIEDVLTGKVEVSQFREVEVEDLLGRDPVELDIDSISEYITDRTVLVTGAGGSIGSEICRQICTFQPKKLILLGHGENSIYQIDMELKNRYQNLIEIIPVIADIQDRDRIFEVIGEYKPYVIYHAAAHKHVPLMELNPMEAVKNNIFGTKNVAEAADTFKVKKFVLISSDKAVNPTNVMGATKRVAELIIQHLATISETTFTAVRFGNVLGSRGSVIPLFKEQIARGGPVTVTHPEMTRYFMTIPEAARLVIQAGALARGGEIFVLDMGEPVKIIDLAKNLIKLSGYSVEEIGIEFIGLRPGEKMYEELLNENEIYPEQIFPKIHIGKACKVEGAILYDFIYSLKRKNSDRIRQDLIELANTKENLDEKMRELIEM